MHVFFNVSAIFKVHKFPKPCFAQLGKRGKMNDEFFDIIYKVNHHAEYGGVLSCMLLRMPIFRQPKGLSIFNCQTNCPGD